MNYPIYLALLLGFGLGVKHATEADHVVAVSTMVTEQRSILRAAAVGALWGVGHTASLVAAGIIVIFLEISIPNRAAKFLEGAVGAMIIFLGGRILYLLFRRQQRVHAHAHVHDGRLHTHLHFHVGGTEHAVTPRADHFHSLSQHSHAARFRGWKPIVVGTVHGLAGSAALMLLVLTEVVRGGSRFLGLAYLFVFGVGSIGGMVLMSVVLSLPLVFTTHRFDRVEAPMRFVVALSSIGFGFYYAWMVMS